jgi:hypothetical protein
MDSKIQAGSLNIPSDSEGGQICKVTTLADVNVVGSFRRAMQHYNLQDSAQPSFCKKGIIFENVSGTISLHAPIELNNKAASGFRLESTSGQVILDATGVGAGNCAITIDSNEVTVRNITIRNASGGGICIKSGSNGNTIDGVTVTRSGHGVSVEGGSQNNTIQNGFFFDNTGFGVNLDDATQNRVTKNAIYRNQGGAVASPATDIQADVTSAAPANQAATAFIISGTVPSAVDHCEVFRGAPSSAGGNGNSNYITDIVNFSALSFVTTIDARQGEEVFLICLAPDGSTSPNSTVLRLSSIGTGPGTGPRPCFPSQEFPPTADFDGDGIYDTLEDKNKNCVVDPGESDPANVDTDGDGCSDGLEDKNKNGELDPSESSPALVDTDGDFINDCQEDRNKNGIRDSGECDPSKLDTDGDGLADNREDLNKNGERDANETDCSIDDSDFDGKKDGEEDINHDGIHDPIRECDAKRSDTDDDGLLDSSDPCCNNRALTCKVPCAPGVEPEETLDNDGDLVPDLYEDLNHDCVVDASETDAFDKDSDDDGFNDRIDPCPVNNPDPTCESVCDPENINPFRDSDGDGLKNSEEDLNGNCLVDPLESDPFNPDTDDDQVTDGNDQCPLDQNPLCDEPCRPGVTPPEGQDSDGDGIPDANEDINQNCIQDINETSYQKRDTDGDITNDNEDPCPLNSDTSCAKECIPGEFIPPQRDSDKDGIKDVLEDMNKNCIVDRPQETDAYNADSDADGCTDGVEDKNQNGTREPDEIDARNPDTDGDGVPDCAEDRNHNGLIDFEECNPINPDTDADTIPDGLEDSNFNGIWDTGETHCARPDTDRDALDDGAEDMNKNGTVDAGETDPRVPDTDGDGATDGQEIANGTNPIISRPGDFTRAAGTGCGSQLAAGSGYPHFYGILIGLIGPAWWMMRRRISRK